MTALLESTQLRFGGEDPMEPADDLANRHHRGVSHEAAMAADWSPGAAGGLSWHAEFVDSDLHNPLWHVQGGVRRIKTALSLARR